MDVLIDPNVLGEVVRRFLFASLAGAILGLPAQSKNHMAGIRTHALVSLGASIFCITAIGVVGRDSSEITRIVQGVASGVGFIGAAAVLHGDRFFSGINTAASIWIAAAVGCATSLVEKPAAALIGAGLATAINWTFMELEARLTRPADGLDRPPGDGRS